jgi:hypothetical protein
MLCTSFNRPFAATWALRRLWHLPRWLSYLHPGPWGHPPGPPPEHIHHGPVRGAPPNHQHPSWGGDNSGSSGVSPGIAEAAYAKLEPNGYTASYPSPWSHTDAWASRR